MTKENQKNELNYNIVSMKNDQDPSLCLFQMKSMEGANDSRLGDI